MTPSADKSAAILADNLRAQVPFLFVRLGDADVPWMLHRRGVDVTCDGEPNRRGLGEELMAAWRKLCECPRFLCGDLLTMEDPAAPDVREDFRLLCRKWPNLKMLHSEALLIHRLSPALKDFYRAVRRDQRNKILVAPHRVSGAALFLGARHCAIHGTHAHEPEELQRTETFMRYAAAHQGVITEKDVVLIAGGRASKLLAARLVDTGATVVELGSALDPLFYGQTRGAQIPTAEARAYFSELWWE